MGGIVALSCIPATATRSLCSSVRKDTTHQCAQITIIPNAGWTLRYLNNYFNVNYHPVAIEFVMSTALISLTLVISLSLLATHNFYQYRSQRFGLRSVQAKLRHAAISIRR